MLIIIGFVESLFLFMIGIVIGVFLAYQLFSYDLQEQLLKSDLERMTKEIEQTVGESE